jgi:hypothetical protein
MLLTVPTNLGDHLAVLFNPHPKLLFGQALLRRRNSHPNGLTIIIVISSKYLAHSVVKSNEHPTSHGKGQQINEKPGKPWCSCLP